MRTLIALTATLTLVAAGCGRSGTSESTATAAGSGSGSSLSGTIEADGSSTVGPYVTYAAETFRSVAPDVRITVGISGTGGGFERFCRGEIDLADASRAIKPEEAKACTDKGIAYHEYQVANDGIAVVVNEQNDWADCLTVAQLKKIWEPGSKVMSWRDVDPSFPDVKLTLAGPGTDSGTFDFFTEEIVGEDGASRSDYNASEDDNVVVQAVSGDEGGLGYFGLSYYEQNQDRLEDVAVDGGSGCVAPTAETVQNGTYEPLSRPLYVYVKTTSQERPEVKAFLQYMLDNEREIAEGALFVPLTDAQLARSRAALGR
jgi:phosphate transport system substrate-binding protein